MTQDTYLTLSETQRYLRIGRTALYTLRLDRKYAKPELQDTIFAAEFEINGRAKFRRADLDAWMATRISAPGRRK